VLVARGVVSCDFRARTVVEPRLNGGGADGGICCAEAAGSAATRGQPSRCAER